MTLKQQIVLKSSFLLQNKGLNRTFDSKLSNHSNHTMTMPRLVFHDFKSTLRRTSIYSNNNNKEREEANKIKPIRPMVKNLKYVDLVITWRKKTTDAKTLSAIDAWRGDEEVDRNNNINNNNNNNNNHNKVSRDIERKHV